MSFITSIYPSKSIEILRRDFRRDPYLKYILLSAILLTGFWFWYRAPNFATPDEYGRLLRPMKAAGNLLSERTLAAFIRGATDGVAQGATFYLYAIALVPAAIIIIGTGQLSTFAEFGSITSRWTLWQSVPAWYWTYTVVASRFVNVLIGVGCVYMMYRLGTEYRDRWTGRFASGLLTISLGFIASAHEVNEDTAMLLLILIAVYLSIRYLDSGNTRTFYAASAVGGLAIAFKLTAGVIVVILLVAHLLRAQRLADNGSQRTDIDPRVLVIGACIGLIVIYVGIPKVLFLGPGVLIERASSGLQSKVSTGGGTLPFGLPMLLAWLNGMGLPLTVASGVGVLSGLRGLSRDGFRAEEVLVYVGLVIYLVVFLQWQNIRTHHLLPVYPFLLLPLGGLLGEHWRHGSTSTKATISLLLLSTAVFAGYGTVQYAMEPRDLASDWLKKETTFEAEVTVYDNSIADVGVPHGQSIDRYDFVEKTGVRQGILNESNYSAWVRETHQRAPEFIQITSTAYPHRHSAIANRFPEGAAYIREMFDGGNGYRVEARFGSQTPDRPTWQRVALAGLYPQIEKHREFVIILQRSTDG